jgi:hypothetical protein
MKEMLTLVKQNLPEAKIWHVRGRFRDFASERETFSFKDFYVISQKEEDFIYFSAKSAQRGQVKFGGITISRYTSLVESQLAKKLLPSRDWKVLVTVLPKERNQRLLIFRVIPESMDFKKLVEDAQAIHQKFLTGVKRLVSDLAQNL